MGDYEIMEPFGIDDGELDGISDQQIFCLGYELAQIHALADKGRAFEKPIHRENGKRIVASLMRRGLTFNIAETEVPEWAHLTVEEMRP